MTGPFHGHLNRAAQDAIALITVALHERTDQAMLSLTAETLRPRDDEPMTEWLDRLIAIAAAQAAIGSAFVKSYAAAIHTDVDDVLQQVAVAQARRTTEGDDE